MIPAGDALAHIRNNRSHYFASSDQIAARIRGEALGQGARETLLWASGETWLVAADIDWFAGARVPTPELFSRILPFSHEHNSMWSEVLLAAYCDSVMTWSRTETLTIKGSPHTLRTLIKKAIRSGSIARVVAFTALR